MYKQHTCEEYIQKNSSQFSNDKQFLKMEWENSGTVCHFIAKQNLNKYTRALVRGDGKILSSSTFETNPIFNDKSLPIVDVKNGYVY